MCDRSYKTVGLKMKNSNLISMSDIDVLYHLMTGDILF